MNKHIVWFGWCGAIAIVLAYALVSFSVLEPTNIWYQLLNGAGALGIVTASFYKRDYSSTALNLVWTLVAVAAIFRILFSTQ